ncbi:hypothetical protein TCAL_05319 [Tigriopus californicus]|uniref:Uncharacterized protein n=1 Tax=Tigriopus californicus TaxID=6832 RepID=A0A553PHU6_TIGCA|nr:hypothetical protein TCAL_05319 [Tigriopus californicus]
MASGDYANCDYYNTYETQPQYANEDVQPKPSRDAGVNQVVFEVPEDPEKCRDPCSSCFSSKKRITAFICGVLGVVVLIIALVLIIAYSSSAQSNSGTSYEPKQVDINTTDQPYEIPNQTQSPEQYLKPYKG